MNKTKLLVLLISVISILSAAISVDGYSYGFSGDLRSLTPSGQVVTKYPVFIFSNLIINPDGSKSGMSLSVTAELSGSYDLENTTFNENSQGEVVSKKVKTQSFSDANSTLTFLNMEIGDMLIDNDANLLNDFLANKYSFVSDSKMTNSDGSIRLATFAMSLNSKRIITVQTTAGNDNNGIISAIDSKTNQFVDSKMAQAYTYQALEPILTDKQTSQLNKAFEDVTFVSSSRFIRFRDSTGTVLGYSNVVTIP